MDLPNEVTTIREIAKAKLQRLRENGATVPEGYPSDQALMRVTVTAKRRQMKETVVSDVHSRLEVLAAMTADEAAEWLYLEPNGSVLLRPDGMKEMTPTEMGAMLVNHLYQLEQSRT